MFRNMLNSHKKCLDDSERQMKAAIATRVIEDIKRILESKSGCQVLVENLAANNNTKALDAALKKIRILSPETSALLISIDHKAEKIYALTSVPKVKSFIPKCRNKNKNIVLIELELLIVCSI